MAVNNIKCIVTALATFIVGLGFRERYLAGPEDAIKDEWWRPSFRQYLSILELSLVASYVWYVFSRASPARRPWNKSEAAAAILALLGGGLRLWAMHTLGRLFTFEVAIRTNHGLIKDGPYAILRHPSYTGAVVGLVALQWLLGGRNGILRSWLYWAIAMPIGIAVIGARVSNEEQVLAAHFGPAWEEYKATRWGLVPFIW